MICFIPSLMHYQGKSLLKRNSSGSSTLYDTWVWGQDRQKIIWRRAPIIQIYLLWVNSGSFYATLLCFLGMTKNYIIGFPPKEITTP